MDARRAVLVVPQSEGAPVEKAVWFHQVVACDPMENPPDHDPVLALIEDEEGYLSCVNLRRLRLLPRAEQPVYSPSWLRSPFRRRLARALLYQWDVENGRVQSVPPIKDLGEVMNRLGDVGD